MEAKRFKAALQEMAAVIEELQKECNEFRTIKSEWYDKQLEQLHSGLSTNHWFLQEVWDVYHSLHTNFDDDLFSLQVMLKSLELSYDGFKKTDDQLRRVVKSSPNRCPWDWNEYKVTYESTDCSTPQTAFFYGPNEEYVKAKCREVYSNGCVINVTKVEKVGIE